MEGTAELCRGEGRRDVGQCRQHSEHLLRDPHMVRWMIGHRMGLQRSRAQAVVARVAAWDSVEGSGHGQGWASLPFLGTWQQPQKWSTGKGQVQGYPKRGRPGTQLSCEDTPAHPWALPLDIHMTHIWLPARPAPLPITLTFLPLAPAGG